MNSPTALVTILWATLLFGEFDRVGGTVAHAQTARFATFNVSLYDTAEGKLTERLSAPGDPQASALAEIIQRVRPDVILLNEFDYDATGSAITHFQKNYLSIAQNVSHSPDGAAEPIEFPHKFLAPSNTGQPSGYDLDRNGQVVSTPGSSNYGGDCWGYGEYPGKYAMVVLSRYPIDQRAVRTFQKFRWKDMPAARLPDNLATDAPADWYSTEALAHFPLSSKSHWDVPIQIAGRTIHALVSHPTPPTYDGLEDRNGRRNHDEIRLWVDYITPGAGSYLYDDSGTKGGLPASEYFVIMGDLNGDPTDGQGKEGIARLLASPRVSTLPAPSSEGGAEQAILQGGANTTHQGDPRLDTLDASDRDGPGNLRVDYVLPARTTKTLASGVFWPKNDDKLFPLVGTHPFPSSDHRLVWIDIEIVGR
ncbi:MAG: endonuclease/exonuclease/phosphatase family protein [Planctomycetes bacterium]|nr:endonuclease/exonuclease/phosphatase family protein [Planctomycetota bacterium]